MSCPITGLAVVTDDEGTLRWDQSDPAIHVSSKLLDTATEAGLAFLTERYELGEWCPHDPFARHARRRDTLPALPVPEWKPTRWWRAVGPDGKLWCESSDEDEVRQHARPGDRIERLFSLTQERWRSA
jgi:hypothetical protein